MKYENLFKIYIPEPCHEDWDKMNPNQQGAFCKVCSKTVVDFSDKKGSEIQNFFSENLDKKICGRFQAGQLAETPRLKIERKKFKIEFPRFLFPISFSPVRAFAMAALLFASVALASCGNSETGDGTGGGSDSTRIEHLMGGATVKPLQKDTTKETKGIDDTNPPPPQWDQQTMGAVNWHLVKKDSVKIDSVGANYLGEVVPQKTDTTQTNHSKYIKMGMVKKVPEKEYLKGDVQIEK
jgi:hypothetical protein